jgi:hypothetical protein
MIIHHKKTDICINFENVKIFQKVAYETLRFDGDVLYFPSEEERDLAFNKVIKGHVMGTLLVEI